jgi:hypothetical protein
MLLKKLETNLIRLKNFLLHDEDNICGTLNLSLEFDLLGHSTVKINSNALVLLNKLTVEMLMVDSILFLGGEYLHLQASTQLMCL